MPTGKLVKVTVFAAREVVVDHLIVDVLPIILSMSLALRFQNHSRYSEGAGFYGPAKSYRRIANRLSRLSKTLRAQLEAS
jgi:hypothetical protein